MKKEFDYAGNEIKEGDEFALIKIINKFPRFGYVVPGMVEFWMNEERPDEECFKIGSYHKVIVCDHTMNELGYVVEIGITGGGSCTAYNTISVMKVMDMDNTVILAIKGISDTKEYYDTWKKKQSLVPAATK